MKRIKRFVKRALLWPGLNRFAEWVIVRKYAAENNRSRRGEAFRTPFVCEYDVSDTERSLRYKDEVFSDYFRLSGLSRAHVNGKRILEIGPGINLGVALEFLLAGASQVVCADRFPSLGSVTDQLSFYRKMREGLDAHRKVDFDSFITFHANSYSLNPDRIQYLSGAPLETFANTFEGMPFDIILSRAVLEHVFELDEAMDSMDKLLAPDGYLLHEVDFRDHGIFTGLGLNPLTFLTVSDAAWIALGSHIGAPNRRLVDYFEMKLASLGYETKMQVKCIFGSDKVIGRPEIREPRDYGAEQTSMIRSIRKRLLPRFQALPPEKLLVSVIFFTARKSARRPP